MNTVGGYMPGKADTVGLGRDGKANSLTYALSKGYVVAAPGARGRTLTDDLRSQVHQHIGLRFGHAFGQQFGNQAAPEGV